jgi:hypothetical protein
MVLRKMSIALGVALAIAGVGYTPSFKASSGSEKSLFQEEHVLSVNPLKNAITPKINEKANPSKVFCIPIPWWPWCGY